MNEGWMKKYLDEQAATERGRRLAAQVATLSEQGRYVEAIAPATELCELAKKLDGSSSDKYSTSLNNLAELYRNMGNYQAAEPLYHQARDITREILGERNPSYAIDLNNLAELYRDMGNYYSAESLFLQALDIWRETLGERFPNYASILNNLAELYCDMGNYQAAEQHLLQALDIWRETLGEHHLSYATSLNNLGMLYYNMGNYYAAEPLYHQARDITREDLGEQHPYYASSLHNLAVLYRDMGDYEAAEPLFRKALDTYRETLGDQHPYYATTLSNLATLLAATDRITEAFNLMVKCVTIEDHVTAQVFSIGSESQRMAYIQRIQASVDEFLSLASQRCRRYGSASRAAMDLVLRRKAIGAEALAAQRDAVLGGTYPDLYERLQLLRMIGNQIAQKTLAGPGTDGVDAHRQLLSELNAQREQLETELAHQIPEMSLEQQVKAADHRAIAQALPDGTALVEFIRFRPFDFIAIPARGEPRRGAPRYLAFVLLPGVTSTLEMIDLGEAEDIDRMVFEFRASIAGEGRGMRPVQDEEVITGAAEGLRLRSTIFDPLLPHLSSTTRIFIAPDGELTRLSFEALPTDDGRRLIDRCHISYLSVGRDVLRFAQETAHKSTLPVIVADPDYDLASSGSPTEGDQEITVSLQDGKQTHPTVRAASALHRSVPADGLRSVTTQMGQQSRDVTSIKRIKRLLNVEEEGNAIGKQLKVTPWLHEQALEGHLKAAVSPNILHVATHGFFLENQQQDTSAQSKTSSFADLMLDRIATSGVENPLLRSGLVLAGANTFLAGGKLPPEAEDGMLTAVDVSGLDLLATELAVLSACETGLGDVQTGEGVFGLRRAFMLAGAKTLLMSLWSVPDAATKELMIDFYERILAGEGRADALRNAQLAIKERYPDPYYWGAFICQGDPSPLKQV